MSTTLAGSRITLKNILFATDLSECANRALPYVLSLARRYGATISAAYVVPSDSTLYYLAPADWAMVDREDEKWIRRYVDTLENQLENVPHRVTTPKGSIWPALAQIIRKQQIDMLVVGTHGRTGASKLFKGSIAENLLRRAECPVLSVGPHVLSIPEPEVRFHRIVFATDFSSESLAALPYAVALAEEDEARLMLLHVVNQPAAGVVNLQADTRFVLKRLRDLIPSDAALRSEPECLVEFGQQFASPADRILEMAERLATDLIVLGVRPAHSESGLATHLSSTAARILTGAPCPVLTVRG